jgi:hypothetical protein
MKLCIFCIKTILESGNPRGYHQERYHLLSEAASSLCSFCAQLHSDVVGFYNPGWSPNDAELLEWPLYRWSVRKLGRIRELNEVAVVTFRPLPHARQENGKPGSGRVLAERRFYLFREQGRI